MRMRLLTIGFTQSTAEHFFTRLQNANVRRVLDVRLHNVSQLAGFAKQQDLPYFLRTIANIDYTHALELAPTPALLDAYRKGHESWQCYAERFTELIATRRVEQRLDEDDFDGVCLLCSEHAPERCHRRLVAEYLQGHYPGLDVVHL